MRRFLKFSRRMFSHAKSILLHNRFLRFYSQWTPIEKQRQIYQETLSVGEPTTAESAINKGFALLAVQNELLLPEASYYFDLAERLIIKYQKNMLRYEKYFLNGNRYIKEFSETVAFMDDGRCLEFIDTDSINEEQVSTPHF